MKPEQSIPDWSTIPGVKYPSHGRLHVNNKKKCSEPIHIGYDPTSWMPTSEAIQLFECSGSAVRIYLHKKKVKSFMTQPVGSHKHRVWNRTQVMRVLEKRNAKLKYEVPTGYISTDETIKLLGCSRSSLYRYEERGLLNPLKVRVETTKGKRVHKVYNVAELERFKVEQAEIEAARQHMLELISKRNGGKR